MKAISNIIANCKKNRLFLHKVRNKTKIVITVFLIFKKLFIDVYFINNKIHSFKYLV